MSPFFDEIEMVGSAGQAPVTFACSFAVSVPATEGYLHVTGSAGVTSAPGTPDLVAASDSGTSATDDITNVTTPTFRVGLPLEAVATDTVRVYRAGSTEIGSVGLTGTDITNGYADVTVGSALSVGNHTIIARVENGAGLSPASAGLALTIDTLAPDAPTAIIVAPADQGSDPLQTDNTQPTFRISLPGDAVAGDTVTLVVDSADDATATLLAADITNGYVDIQASSALAVNAEHDISAYESDVAGNIGSAITAVTVTVGTVAGIPAVIFDGANDFRKITGDPTGVAAGADWTMMWAGRFNSDDTAMTLREWQNATGIVASLRRTATNTIEFKSWQSDNVTAVFSNVTTAISASLGYVMILASCTGTASVRKVLHAGGTITGANTAGTAGNIDPTSDWYYGKSGADTEYVDANVSYEADDAQYIDFTVTDNVEEFYDTTNKKPRDPGATGANAFGAQPLASFQLMAANALTNKGTGGDADTGSVSGDDVSPGAWGANYSPGGAGIVLEAFVAPAHINDLTDSQKLTLSYPATVNANDFLLAEIATDWYDSTTPPVGWTVIETTGVSDGAGGWQKIESYGRIADGTEGGGTPVFQGAGGGLTQLSGGTMRFSGVDVSGGTVLSCLDATTTEATGNDAAPTAPDITTSTAGACVVRLFGNDGVASSGAGAPASQIYDEGADVGSGNGMGIMASYALQATPGAAGTAAGTLTGAHPWVAQTIALKAA